MKRVFVTGLGVVSPAGVGVSALWEDLLATRTRFSRIDAIYPGMEDGYVAGRLSAADRARDLSDVHDGDGAPATDSSSYALHAVRQALADAGLEPHDPALRDAVVCLGNNEAEADLLDEHVEGRGDRWASTIYSSHAIAENVAREVGAHGPAFCVHNTCASANVALEFALRMLRSGAAETAIVGGADAFSHKVWTGFATLKALGPDRCRPFSRERRFITISEGAAVLVLQAGDAPPRSTRTPYAELLAAASNNDAKHPTNPDRAGVGACHDLVLERAGVAAGQIDAILAHGTGTKANDSVEAEIFSMLHPQAAVTAVKGTVGHLMATAGALGALTACVALDQQTLPATNIRRADFEYDFDLVLDCARPGAGLEHVQNNAFGFGGNNAITLFKAVA